MIKILFGMLLKLRQGLQAIFARLFEKIRDPKSGKIDGISPRNIIMVFWIVGVIFFFMVVASQIISDKSGVSGGAEDFRKELTPRIGITDNPSDLVFDDDPLGDMLRQQKQNTFTKEQNNGNDFGVFSADGGTTSVPSKDECVDLMDRMKSGEDLVGSDKEKLNICLDKNVGEWSEDQLQFAKTLLNDNTLTPEEKELLRKGVAGTLSPEELVLARALSGSDPTAKEIARQAIQRNADEETKKALASALQGKPTTSEQKSLISDFFKGSGSGSGDESVAGAKEKSILDYLSQLASNGKAGQSGLDGKDGSQGLSAAQLEALTAEMAAKENELVALQRAVAEAQAAAARAGQRLADGKTLTAQEQAAIARLAELQKKLAEQEQLQNQRRALVMKEASKLSKTLAAVANTIDQVVPSSFSVAYEDAPSIDCKTIKPIGKSVARIKKKKGGDVILGLDGKPLSPDKVKLLAIRRKEMSAFEKARENLLNPTGANGGFTSGSEALDPEAVLAVNGGQPQEIQSLFVFSDRALKPFVLTPDMKIPAVLLNMVLVSNKGRPQIVRVKVLDDVYNPENNQIVIPKGSIIVGSTQSFDEDTGIMDLSFDKVSVGSGKVIPAKFTVGSADGSMGLRGEIRDTRGKYLLGAFITSFSAGALNWFSQQVVQPFQTSPDAGNALLGAGLGGSAEVMNKISEMYAGDLQNAAKIYYVPKGVPLVLYPNE